jgi:hypothetical protein
MPFLDFAGAGSVNAGGFYRKVLVTGKTTGLSANDPIFSLRWAATPHQFILVRAEIEASIDTAFGTAQLTDFELIVARGFTAVDSGGTAATLTGSNAKLRTSGGVGMGTSLISDLRAATTGALTAGTRTLDSTGIAYAMLQQANGLGNSASKVLYQLTPFTSHPLVLTGGTSSAEGLIGRVPTAQGATGKVIYALTLEWAEAAAYFG